jgi:O-Antigen ligase
VTPPAPDTLSGPAFGPPPPRPAMRNDRLFPPLLLGAALVGFAAAVLLRQPLLVIEFPVVAAIAVACVVRPAAAVVGVVFLSGAIGSLEAFTPLSVTHFVHLLLVVLWLGVIGLYLSGRALRLPRLWLPLVPLVAYVALTAFEIPFTQPIKLGLDSFRAVAWYMAAVPLIALAPWRRATHLRIARGFVAVAVIIGAYCMVRWLVGPAASETAVARVAQPGLPPSVTARFFGSFESANELAAWGASLIPFCFALALVWRGRWRLACMAATASLALAVVASSVRTGTVAAVAGILVTLLLFYLSRASRTRLATGVWATALVAVIGIGSYSLAVEGSSEQVSRFSNILHPAQDKGYSDRVMRWQAAIRDMNHNPWGHGLGTAGGVAAEENPFGPVVTPYLDSSYLKVGLEQGYAVMVLYALAMLVLLVGLARGSLGVGDPEQAALIIGGAGTLTALMVLFYAGLYSQGTPVVASWLIVGLGAAQLTLRPERSAQPWPRRVPGLPGSGPPRREPAPG